MLFDFLKRKKGKSEGTQLPEKTIEIQGAQWSASLDDSCKHCQRFDEKVISVNNPYWEVCRPPQHEGCKCIWVYIAADEENVEFNWRTPSAEWMKEHAPHWYEKRQKIDAKRKK